MKTLSIRYFITSLAITLVSASVAMAQHEGGNGGGAYVCFGPEDPVTHKPQIRPGAQSLDFWENEKWSLDFTLPADNTNPDLAEAKVLKAISKIARFDPAHAKKLTDQYYIYKAQFHPEKLRGITHLDDATIAYKPKEVGCDTVQAAFFRHHPNAYQWKYVIDEDIWNSMDSTARAGLMLHEVIYYVEGASNSDFTREMVRMAFSKDIESWTPRTYNQFMYPSRAAEQIQAKNGLFSRNVESFSKDGLIVTEGALINEYPFTQLDGQSVEGSCGKLVRGRDYRGKAYFDDSGNLITCDVLTLNTKTITISGWTEYKPNVNPEWVLESKRRINYAFGTIHSPAGDINFKDVDIKFNPDFSLKRVEMYHYSGSGAYPIMDGFAFGKTLFNKIQPDYPELYPSGAIRSFKIESWIKERCSFFGKLVGMYGRANKITFPDGTELKVKCGHYYNIEVSEDGKITNIADNTFYR